MLVGIEPLPDVHLSIAEEIERRTLGLPVLNAIENRFRRMALMNKQRHCRDRYLMPLGLACPIQERLS